MGAYASCNKPLAARNMWLLLANPTLAESISQNCEEFSPFVELVEQLSKRSYANQIHAFISHASFVLTTAATYQEADGHDWVSVTQMDEGKLYAVAYEAWVSVTRNPKRSISDQQTCELANVPNFVDSFVLRMLTIKRV